MAEIDSLEIQITASSRAAYVALDNLNDKLKTLAGRLNFRASGLEALDNINGTNIRNLGIGLSALGKGLTRIQGIQRIDFGKVARDIRKLSNIPAGNLETLGNSMRPLADGINALSKAKIENSNLANLINSLTRLSSANLANLDGTNFTRLGTSIKEFANAVSGAEKVEQSTIAMTNAVAKLAGAGKNIGKVTGALPHLANNLKGFMDTMSRAPQVSNEITTFTQAVGTLANAGDKAKATAGNLGKLADELKNFMQTMSTAPNVSDSVIRMTDALSRLSSQGGRVSVSTNSLSSSFSRSFNLSGKLGTSFKKLSSAMSGLSGAAKNASGNFKGFLRQLMSATGVYFSIYGAIRGLKSAIDISSDLTEVQNVVDVAFGNMAYKVEEFAKVSVKDFGMSELTTKQIAGRYQAMATAIGVSADKIGQANTFLKGQTKGYVDASDSMADVSVNLTKLAADMASFYNVEQTDVAKSLESIFTGTTAPLRRYGLDLTQATLSEWAMKQGLDADIKSMSQAEKTMLRYQYVLANTTAAQGDFARTADSWANQTRVLVQQLEILGSVVGGVLINAFKPLVKTLNAVMTKVISFAKTIADALGTIFGWTFEVNPGGMTNDFGDMSSGIEDVADSADDAKDNLKDTNKEAKDLKANLQGFDKLNVISLDKDKDKDKDKGKGKDKDKGAGLGGIGGLDTNLFEVDSVMKKYKSSIDTLYKLGEHIGDTLTDALNSINWDKVYAAADNFGIGLALFLNGLISPELFAAVGQTIAGALNTALHALDNFGATFDWKNLGDSLSAGLVAFLKGIDWESALSAAANWGTGIATTLNSFISPENFGLIGESVAKAINVALEFLDNFGTTFKWTNFGKSLGTGLNKFLKGLNWKSYLKDAKTYGKGIARAINAFLNETDFKVVGESVAQFLNGAIVFAVSSGKTIQFKTIGKKIADGLNGFFRKLKVKELAEAINVWVKGALTTVSTLLKKTDFEMIGRKIGKFLAELDFLEIIGKLAGALLDAIKGAFDMLSGMLSEAPLETILIAAFAAMKFLGVGKTIASAVSNSLATSLAGTLGVSLTSQNATISGVVTTALQNAFNGPIQTVVGNLGKIAGAVAGAAAAFGEFTVVSGSIENLATGTGNWLIEIGKISGAVGIAAAAMTAAFGFPAGVVVAAITGVVGAIKGINDAFKEIETEKFGESVKGALEKPGGVPIEDLINSVSTKIQELGQPFTEVAERSNELNAAKDNVKSVVTEIEKIKTSMEAGVLSTEEGTSKLKAAYKDLADAITNKIGMARDVLLATFGSDSLTAEALESTGLKMNELTENVVQSTDEQIKHIGGLAREIEALRETDPTNPRIAEAEAELYSYANQTDGTRVALDNFQLALSNGLNWSKYFNTDDFSLETDALESDLKTIGESLSEYDKNAKDALMSVAEAALEAGDEKTYTALKNALPEAMKYSHEKALPYIQQATDMIQRDAIGGIEKIVDDKVKEWENMSPGDRAYQASLGFHTKENYVLQAVKQYKEKIVDPLTENINKQYEEFGIAGSAKASEVTQEIIDSLFDEKVRTGPKGIGAFFVSMESDYNEKIQSFTKNAVLVADKDGKDIGKALTDGLEAGINSDKAFEIGKKLGDTTAEGTREGVDSHSPSEVYKSIGKDIVDGLLLGIENNWKKVSSWWKTNAKLPEIKAKVEDLKKKVADEWKKVTNYWKKKELEITSKFKTTKENVNSWWKNVKTWWGEKNLTVKNDFKTSTENVTSWWNTLVKWWGDKKLSVKNDFKTTSENVASWWAKLVKWWGKKNLDVKNAFKTTKDNVVSWWTKVKNWWATRELAVKTKYTTTKETVQKWGKNTVSWLKSGISGAWAEFSNWFTEKMKKLMNGAIKGMNWVLKGVGSKTRVPEWTGHAKGSDGLPTDEVGMVNDQRGSTYKELIVPPHGRPFVPEGRNVVLPMKKGTKILPADKTKQLLEIIPHFANGIGDFKGSIFDYLDKPKEILKIGLDKHMDLSGLGTPILDIANGMKKLFSENGTDFIKKEFDKALTVNYKVGAGVKQWSGLAAKALQITGQYSAANLSYLLQQMHHESRGNPNAINLWDSNAKKGTPSKGLMQVIDPTFRSFAKPPYNKNIYDPLSNIIASIRYAVAAYGSLYNAWAARGFKGYAEGIGKITLSDVIPGFANGGFPASGQLFMARENGISEMVGRIGNSAAVANNQQIVKSVSSGVQKAVEKSFAKVTNDFSKTGDAIKNSVQDMAGFAKESAEKTGAAINAMSGSVSSAMQSAVNGAFAAQQPLVSNGTQTVEVEITGDIGTDAYEAGASAVSDFSEGMKNYIGGMEDWVSRMRETAMNGFTEMADNVYIYGGDAVLSYADGIYENYDQLDEAVDGMAEDLAGGFSGTEYEVQIDGGNVVAGLNTGMSEKWTELMEWAQSAREQLLQIFSSMREDMYQSGTEMMTGLLEGIDSLMERLTEYANSIKATMQSVTKMAAKIEQAQAKTKSANSMKVSDATEEKLKKAGSYKVADLQTKGKAASAKTVESKFTKAKGTAVDSSFSKDLVNGVSIGVADAVNKILVPALENERNLNISLKGDTGKLFTAMQEKAQKYRTITGNAPF